jgi:hypothetical protein
MQIRRVAKVRRRQVPNLCNHQGCLIGRCSSHSHMLRHCVEVRVNRAGVGPVDAPTDRSTRRSRLPDKIRGDPRGGDPLTESSIEPFKDAASTTASRMIALTTINARNSTRFRSRRRSNADAKPSRPRSGPRRIGCYEPDQSDGGMTIDVTVSKAGTPRARLADDRPTFVGVGHRLGLALEVVGLDRLDGEVCPLEVARDGTAQMAATGESLVQGLQPLLPPNHVVVRCLAVFDEVKWSAGGFVESLDWNLMLLS